MARSSLRLVKGSSIPAGLLLGALSLLLLSHADAFSILKGPFPPVAPKPVKPPKEETNRLFFVPKIKEQLSSGGGVVNESFILFANDHELDSSDAKRLLYRSFHTVSITYGWCLAPADVKALKSLREELFAELDFVKDPFYLAKIEVALQLAFHAHHGQKRKSGEAFVNHPVAVAKILAQLRMDPDSIAAGLLHDTVEDTYISLNDIQDVFGQSVRRLVEGETKVSRLPRSTREGHSRSNEQAENLCHLIFAMAEDWRVLVVKLADRLHNMRTLDAMPRHKQERTARETLEIFVPLADKLGAWMLKTELEELSFRILDPTKHMALNYMTENQLSLLSSVQTTNVPGGLAKATAAEALTLGIPRLLKSHKVLNGLLENTQVLLARKPSYQIWKEDPTLLTIERQEDLLVARVVLSSSAEAHAGEVSGGIESDRALCYRALELLQSAFPAAEAPKPAQDFIRYPKENGYQALHAPIRIKGFPCAIQLQVCMDWMDDVAKHGMLGSSGARQPGGPSADVALKLPWLRAMGAAAESVLEAEPTVTAPVLMRSLKEHLTVRRLVFTTDGDILNLEVHEGVCTARDAALAQLQGSCAEGGANDLQRLVGASVNGRHVPLSRALRHGDVVGVITRPYVGGRPQGSKPGSESAVQSKKPLRLWPWCLVGDEDMTERSALQAMWGSRVHPQRATRPGSFMVDGGELQWLREAELRHGRMGMAAVLYWWLSPLLMLPTLDSFEPSSTVAELIMWKGFLEGGITMPPPTPWLVQAALMVGLVELGYSVLMTQRLDESGLSGTGPTRGAQPSSPPPASSSASSRPRASGSSVAALGVSASDSIATILAAFRQQELSWGRLSMLGVLSVLAQALVLHTFGTTPSL